MPMDKTARDRISTHMGAKLWANSFQTATLIFVMRLHVKNIFKSVNTLFLVFQIKSNIYLSLPR